MYNAYKCILHTVYKYCSMFCTHTVSVAHSFTNRRPVSHKPAQPAGQPQTTENMENT